MKKFLILVSTSLVLLACSPSVFGKGADELHLSVRLTTGERSKDSSSQSTTITVEGDTIVLTKRYGGRRRTTPPVQKEFKLSPADKQNLIALIRSNNLLVTESIELPRASSNYRYFEIGVALSLDEQKGAIRISAMRTAVEIRQEKLYQNTITLLKELYRIMSLQGNRSTFEDLVDEPREP